MKRKYGLAGVGLIVGVTGAIWLGFSLEDSGGWFKMSALQLILSSALIIFGVLLTIKGFYGIISEIDKKGES